MQKVLIVEDDTKQLDVMYNIIHDSYKGWHIDAVSGYNDAVLCIHSSINNNELYTLFLFDVQLSSEEGDRGGFFLAQMLREHTCYFRTPILFLTAVSDDNYFALSRFHCYNYIPKPYLPDDILSEIHQMLITGYLQASSIEIPDTQRVLHRISLSEITCITSASHVLHINTDNCSFKTRHYTLDSITTILNDDFVRCHRQYIINTDKITSFDRTARTIIMKDKTTIPVGKIYIQNINFILKKRGL